MEEWDDSIFGDKNIKHKTCWNCKARILWDDLNKRWYCKLCGATD